MRALVPNERLRLRPVPEMDLCVAYLRPPPRLVRLNLEAWALVEAVANCAPAADQMEQVSALLAEHGWRMGEAALQAALEELVSEGLLVPAVQRENRERQEP